MLQLVLELRESFVEEKVSWRFGSLAASTKVKSKYDLHFNCIA